MNKDEKKPELSPDTKFEMMLAAFTESVKSIGLSEDKLEAILTRAGAATATGMQKAIRPENEIPPLMSAFNPLGDNVMPKTPLTRKTYLNGHPEHNSDSSYMADMLLQAEIDSYNELGAYLEGVPERRIDARNGLYRAELRNRNAELHIEVPVATLDTRANLPPTLIMLCHELKTGESMMDLNSLLAEVMRLRGEVERMGGKAGTRPFKAAGPTTITSSAGPLVADLEKALDSTPTATLAGA